MDGARPVRSPRGTTLTARQWSTEAPLRMLMNNLDPENAENPAELVVYGGTGKAARNWESYDALVRTLTTLPIAPRTLRARVVRAEHRFGGLLAVFTVFLQERSPQCGEPLLARPQIECGHR